MPYITEDRRVEMEMLLSDLSELIKTPGEFNYVISKLADYAMDETGVGYWKINELVGVLECAKLELYRRMAVPYENQKLKENGEVYSNVNVFKRYEDNSE